MATRTVIVRLANPIGVPTAGAFHDFAPLGCRREAGGLLVLDEHRLTVTGANIFG
jgi:hypothetical protein